MLLLWPGRVRRKKEDDFGRIGPALFAGINNSDSSINKISSNSYRASAEKKIYPALIVATSKQGRPCSARITLPLPSHLTRP